MDAKNLAVLQQLKDSIPPEPIPEAVFTPHALDLLRELAEFFKSGARLPAEVRPAKSKLPKTKKTKKEKHEAARKNLKRREAVMKEIAAKELAAKYRNCRECGDPVYVGDQIPLHPVRCKHCKRRSSEIDLGLRSRSGVEFSSVRVVAGGAPGLGKRK